MGSEGMVVSWRLMVSGSFFLSDRLIHGGLRLIVVA